MSSGTLAIRADASVAIGTGHVMRCLALAQSWQDSGGNAVFAMAESTAAIRQRLLPESCAVFTIEGAPGSPEDARALISLAREQGAKWVAVDGYKFNGDYQDALKAAGLKVLFLDDYGHAGHYSADLVLNQNLSADPRLYTHRECNTRLLLGTCYCMLRREFNAWRGWKREIPDAARKILVTVGGSDPDNVTLRVMRAIENIKVPDLDLVVVVGGSNPHLDSVQRAASSFEHKPRVVTNVANMSELMAWADLAISGAGSTCWEMCALGLPALLICVAENQKVSAERLAAAGAARLLDIREPIAVDAITAEVEDLARSRSLRERICRTGCELVDCNGASRVVSVMRD